MCNKRQKYDRPTSFDRGDHRSGVKGFTNQEIIDKMKQNKKLLDERFSKHNHPTMYGVINALFTDASSGCVLLGQRNTTQVEVAAALGDIMSEEDSNWVRSLYKT